MIGWMRRPGAGPFGKRSHRFPVIILLARASRAIAALSGRLADSSGSAWLAWTGKRKVRTPQGSVLANGEGRRWMDAQASRTPPARTVPQKTYRLKPALARACDWVRVKWCGLRKRPQCKSAPLGQRCSRQGKPHTEQDQIGGEERPAPSRASGRSLDLGRKAEARGMIASRFGGDRIRLTGFARAFVPNEY